MQLVFSRLRISLYVNVLAAEVTEGDTQNYIYIRSVWREEEYSSKKFFWFHSFFS